MGRLALRLAKAEALPYWSIVVETCAQALECGYYDGGSFTLHAAQSVQPGCTYRAVSQDPNGMRAGLAGAVPAGAQFKQDAAWMETQILGRK